MDERKERCETCRFWTGQREIISCRLPLLVGDCYRYPPSKYLRDSDGDTPKFELWFRPEMLSDDWCGEWQTVGFDETKAPQLLYSRDVSERLACTLRQASLAMCKMEHVRRGKEILVTEHALAKWIKDHTEPPC